LSFQNINHFFTDEKRFFLTNNFLSFILPNNQKLKNYFLWKLLFSPPHYLKKTIVIWKIHTWSTMTVGSPIDDILVAWLMNLIGHTSQEPTCGNVRTIFLGQIILERIKGTLETNLITKHIISAVNWSNFWYNINQFCGTTWMPKRKRRKGSKLKYSCNTIQSCKESGRKSFILGLACWHFGLACWHH